jgi:hypothetical protein
VFELLFPQLSLLWGQHVIHLRPHLLQFCFKARPYFLPDGADRFMVLAENGP